MKHKFLMTIGIMFGAGLLLCGIGGGIIFAELQSFTYEGRKYPDNELTTDVITLKLPENEPVYCNTQYFAMYDINIKNSEDVPKREIRVEVTHTDEYSNINAEIENEYYIWDEDMLYISEHPVNSFNIQFDTHYINNDFESFRTIIQDIRERKIYNYDRGSSFTININVNPADQDRFKKLKNNQSFITYREYKENYAPDPENSAIVSDEDGPTLHMSSEADSSEIQQETDGSAAESDPNSESSEMQQETDSPTVKVVPVDPAASEGNNSVDESYDVTYPQTENKIYTTE